MGLCCFRAILIVFYNPVNGIIVNLAGMNYYPQFYIVFRLWLALLLPGTLFVSCGNPQPEVTTPSFTQRIETAHHLGEWQAKDGFQFNFYLEFGGTKRMQALVIMETSGSKVRMELDNGIVATFDGEEGWYTPDTTEFKNARFNIRTWPYFVEAAMKLSDPGSHMEEFGLVTLNGKVYDAGRMTFDDGVGDSPKDWYIAYADTATNMLEVLAYIVTYKKTVEEANADPHAIVYSKYVDVEGIPVASQWDFYAWRSDAGLTDKLGHARLSNMQFVQIHDSLFAAPPGAVKTPLIP